MEKSAISREGQLDKRFRAEQQEKTCLGIDEQTADEDAVPCVLEDPTESVDEEEDFIADHSRHVDAPAYLTRRTNVSSRSPA